MPIRYPEPLKPGDRVGVTAPSSGVRDSHRERLPYAIQAIRDRGLGIPVVADVECGHVPPYLPIVSGALGQLEFGAGTASLTQTLA